MPLEIRSLTPLIQVYDMPTLVHFYCQVLGFDLVSHSPLLPNNSFNWCLLRLGQAELMLNTAYESDHERPAQRDPARTAAHEDTGLFIGCPDADAAHEEFTAKGLKLDPPKIGPYGMKQLYVRDPDGYALCFQWSP